MRRLATAVLGRDLPVGSLHTPIQYNVGRAAADGTSGDASSRLRGSFKGRCLLTPTYPPHFEHVAILLRAIDVLARDPVDARPAHLVIFDTEVDLRHFCRQQPAACREAGSASAAPPPDALESTTAGPRYLRLLATLQDMLEYFGDSWHDYFALKKDMEQNHEPGTDKAMPLRFGACTTSWSQAHQALKKIYGMLYASQRLGCQTTWVMDSESFPLRPFKFSDIFDVYTSRPFVQLQDYGAMVGVYGASAAIFQECAHWIITQKLRLVPAGVFGYRQSDFWIYENWRVAAFVREVSEAWGAQSFLEWWFQAPVHGEGLVLTAWLHVRYGSYPGQHSGSNARLHSVDVAQTVKEAMPELYAAACRNESFAAAGGELACAEDFAVVGRVIQALGLPSEATELSKLLNSMHSESPSGDGNFKHAIESLLELFRVLDTLPIFGMQGHRLNSQLLHPAMLPHWRRATTWCLSNCDWRDQAGPVLRGLGLSDVYDAVLHSVEEFRESPKLTESRSGNRTVRQETLLVGPRHFLEDEGKTLRCLQWRLWPGDLSSSPLDSNASGTASRLSNGAVSAWRSWDDCLDIMHAIAE
eukprot:TRINITY_DN19942_c0_g1_i1.p1 TRINITY_DN19942_c0_g1~~TRINITY_DN19942_c0_g1_i1.p1  ORF type:complete len:585 (+),score=86.88 TRINITY_DN19942_c0_g1_i1:1029-2783(+)